MQIHRAFEDGSKNYIGNCLSCYNAPIVVIAEKNIVRSNDLIVGVYNESDAFPYHAFLKERYSLDFHSVEVFHFLYIAGSKFLTFLDPTIASSLVNTTYYVYLSIILESAPVR